MLTISKKSSYKRFKKKQLIYSPDIGLIAGGYMSAIKHLSSVISLQVVNLEEQYWIEWTLT